MWMLLFSSNWLVLWGTYVTLGLIFVMWLGWWAGLWINQSSHTIRKSLEYLSTSKKLWSMRLFFHLVQLVNSTELVCYSDSDWCEGKVDRRSTTRYLFMYLWAMMLQEEISGCQATWLINFLQELKFGVQTLMKLLIDNRSTISLVKNPVLHRRRKHIDTKLHFLRNQVQSGMRNVVHCNTQKQLTDVLIKTIKSNQFIKLR